MSSWFCINYAITMNLVPGLHFAVPKLGPSIPKNLKISILKLTHYLKYKISAIGGIRTNLEPDHLPVKMLIHFCSVKTLNCTPQAALKFRHMS